jgi:phage/plasmid-like protein (TIGR03299 family)
MPAYFESGLFVRVPAWHGMGVVVDDYPGSWDEARKLAGLAWEPVSAPAYGFSGLTAEGMPTFDIATAATGDYHPVEGSQRIVRSDTGATLGFPTDSYAVISNAEIGSIIEAVLGADVNAKYETAVCLEGGKSVAAVVLLDEPVTLPGDNSVTLPYMALTARHDGDGSCRAQSTSVRIVCANTRAAAEAEADRNGTVFVFSHRKNWRDHVEEARVALAGLRTDFAEYVEFATRLSELPASPEQTATFIAEFIPAPMESVAASDRVMRNIEEARLTVKAILASPTCETIAGTAFGLVQAADEYLDHYVGYRSKDTYLGRQLLKPQKRKVLAAQLAQTICGG